MPYQGIFKPSPKFHTFVQPFLSKLPKTPSDPPLGLEINITEVNSVRYQWYNWMTNTCPNEYRISSSYDRQAGKAYLYIYRQGNYVPKVIKTAPRTLGTAPSEIGHMPPPVDETDAALQELAKQIEKDLSCKEDFSPGERKPITLKDL